MNILITNDDGIDFKGLRQLVKTFSELGDVYVVAPNDERSSNSHHLTVKGKVRYEKRDVPYAKKAYALWGTPADCVHMALFFLIGEKIDLVVSGINKGANVSTDIIYSGTIAAAREAFIYHVPAIALSLNSFVSDRFETAARYGLMIAKKYLESERKTEYFLNINVPDLEAKDVKGILLCDRVGMMVYHDLYSGVEEDGVSYIAIGHSKITFEGDENDLRIDNVAIENGYVAVSPLGNDHIDYDHMGDAGEIVKNSVV
ncbi:MAG: 5'/3'-nucleotidase SurE [Erysipelotrichaceae bacterium]|nr:5'/3'-nucleotidase SurE [Erysipelotrichaceae bacterium]MBQ2584963.1 5'/3'-nucleotidase SurE [Erysipelotrichaceae bacterium]